MDAALELAESRWGRTWPNPTVGAVIVRDGQVVGQGFHAKAGDPHAEAVALQEAGDAARGATMYVTLEPCSHYGRTPPCTEAIIAAGIAEVVVATPDPHPLVAGRGLLRLREAGISVTVGVGAERAVRLNEPFFTRAVLGRPWVLLKSAVTLDGCIATASGHSRWVSGLAARQEVHRLRQALPAIMVGVGTVLADNPLLTARDENGRPVDRQPVRIVVDTEARTPPTARMLSQPGSTVIACGEGSPADRRAALEKAGADVVVLPRGADGRVDLPQLMEHLGSRNIVGVLLEGGGTLARSMLAANLIDEAMFYIAPLLIGGDGVRPFRGPGAATMDEARRLHDVTCRTVGDDWQVRGTLLPFPERLHRYFGDGARSLMGEETASRPSDV